MGPGSHGTAVPGFGLGPGLIHLVRLGLGQISLRRLGSWDLCLNESQRAYIA